MSLWVLMEGIGILSGYFGMEGPGQDECARVPVLCQPSCWVQMGSVVFFCSRAVLGLGF